MNRGWLGSRNLSFSFLWVQILSCPGVWTFLGAQSYLGVSWHSWNLCLMCSAIAAQGLAANWSSCGDKNCIVCRLFWHARHFHYYYYYYYYYYYLYYYFLCWPVKLPLSQSMSFPFCPFSSPYHRVGRGGGSKWLSGPSCWLPGWTMTFSIQQN